MSLFQRDNLTSWLLPIAVLFTAVVIYFYPVILGDQVIAQDDIMMGLAKGKEIVDHREATGEEPLWTNSMFSGMPTFQISTEYPNNWLSHLQGFMSTVMIKHNGIYIILSLMIGFFALMRSEKVRPELATIAALAFGFSAFFIISLAAGHNAKIRTAAYMAPLIMGVLLTYKGKHLVGFALTALFTGLSIHANHFQITYYTAIPILAAVITYGFIRFKAGESRSWIKQSFILLAAAALGIGPNIGNLWSSSAYTEASMRGGHSALVEDEGTGGLDFDYAMSWSYGPAETLNLIIPNATGGGAKQSYPDSKLHELLVNNFRSQGMGKPLAEKQAEQVVGQVLYFGNQSLVNGAYYVGAAVFLLFLIGLFVVRGATLWLAVGSLLLVLLMAWGKHLPGFNGFLFDHMPLYNKFRVPSMVLVVAFMVIPWIGFKGLEGLLNMDKAKALTILKRSGLIALGLCGVIYLFGGMIMGLDGSNDAYWASKGLPMDIVLDDRSGLIKASALRSLMVMAAAWLVLFLHQRGTLKTPLFIAALGLIIVGDLWSFDKDQLGHEDFITQQDANARLQPTATDLFILKDADPHYRVLNTTVNLTSDSYTSAHHRSIGGYHGAKLARYQDLIAGPMSAGKLPIFGMLNAKWFIVSDGQGGNRAELNPEACGHAWFPTEIRVVDGANEAMNAISAEGFNPKTTAIVESDMIDPEDAGSYAATLRSATDSSFEASIDIVKYAANVLTYQVKNLSKDRYVLFSEVFYQAPGQAWTLTADGVDLDILRANYILRSAVIPAGTEELVFSFHPETYRKGESINLLFSILLLLTLLGAGWAELRAKQD